MRRAGGLTRIALVTSRQAPDATPDDRLLLEPLLSRGVEAVPARWDDDSQDWFGFAAAVIRSTWDYHLRAEEFTAWLDRCAGAGVSFYNPPSVLRWNLHKGYLTELAAQGVAVVPTVAIRRGSDTSVGEILEQRGWTRAVLKPAVSAGAHRTWLIDQDALDGTAAVVRGLIRRRDVLLQPFLEQVRTDGEWSLIFFAGSYSHAALKRCAPGEFRVQERFGGRIERRDPPESVVQAAHEVLAVAARLLGIATADLLYARVDGIMEGEGFVLLELEVLEPSLFLALHPAAPDRFASAIAALVD